MKADVRCPKHIVVESNANLSDNLHQSNILICYTPCKPGSGIRGLRTRR